MKRSFRLLSFIVLLKIVRTQSQIKEVRCEDVNNLSLDFVGVQKTCTMTNRATIDTSDYEISASLKDDNMGALYFWGNKNISYLPIHTYKIFPNLVMMDAGQCSLKNISKSNFRNLAKLRVLLMCCNQIENVDEDTFKDSPLLEYIGLDKNNINSIEDQTFVRLNNLKMVWLESNECISINFGDATKLATLNTEVVDRCGSKKQPSLIAAMNQIHCEKVEFTYMHFVGSPKTCILTDTTIIDSRVHKFVNERDDTLQALKLWGNKQISYLPIEVSKTFKNLVSIDAGGCAIRSLTSENFRNLRKLQVLLMCCNLIENIESDTFDGLHSLEYLGLDKNNINSIEDQTFVRLNNLKMVWLESNECISINFGDTTTLATLNTEVVDRCGSKKQPSLIAALNQIHCEKVEFTYMHFVGSPKTCILTDTTIIDSRVHKFVNERDDDLQALKLWRNKRISYLPIEVSNTFKNLVSIDAGQCAIRSLTRENFRDLRKLQALLMCCNLIENIESDTFNGLHSLEYLGLDGNNIKSIGDGAFNGLNLAVLWLEKNECIDEHFEGDNKIATVNQVIAEKCGSIETTKAPALAHTGHSEEVVTPTCGRRLIHHTALITNGFESREGDWPWHAAIYHLENVTIKYRCGGTVLSSNSILTAAHCLIDNGRQIVPERVLVDLGKFNLLQSGPNTQELVAFKVVIHPGYSASNYSNDIAIIRLSTEVTFNNYIQPICLWNSNSVAVEEVEERFGTVVGWGITETDKLSYVLRQAVMPVVSLYTCLNSNDFFKGILSGKNFCAGFRNGTSVCNGDSGGSLTFEENGVYRIRGIVSVAVSREYKELCDTKEYVVFTDVAQYITWIEEVVPQLKRSP